MDTLTRGEQKLFSKYWGTQDLEKLDEFWEDAYQVFLSEQINVALPLKYNPTAVRMIHDMLDCPSGKCGDCCRYTDIPINQRDIDRIVANTGYTLEYLMSIIQPKGDEFNLAGKDGCPFLKDNACTIYKWRPDTCYLFPIQSTGVSWLVDGKPTEQMLFRIKCRISLAIVRNIFKNAMSPERLLLPNLTLISREA